MTDEGHRTNETPPRKALHDIATAELERELRSGEALGTRAAALIGFCGLVLTLATALARDTAARDLGTIAQPLAYVALIAAVLLVAASAVVATTTLRPSPRGRTKPEVLRELQSANNAERGTRHLPALVAVGRDRRR